MKALSIDSSSSFLTVSAKNELLFSSMSLDVGVKQVEYILSMIENVLKEVNLQPKELQFTCLCTGPGSFTGLRLGFAALKAIQTAYNIPVYGIPTLEAIAVDYQWFKGYLLPCLDARRDRFYVNFYKDSAFISGPHDYTSDQIISNLTEDKDILLVGNGSCLLKEQLLNINPKLTINCIEKTYHCANTLLNLGENMFLQNLPCIESYEGPAYIRDEHGNS